MTETLLNITLPKIAKSLITMTVQEVQELAIDEPHIDAKANRLYLRFSYFTTSKLRATKYTFHCFAVTTVQCHVHVE